MTPDPAPAPGPLVAGLPEALVGKTIERTAVLTYGDDLKEVGLRFTDGTYAVMRYTRISRGFGLDDLSLGWESHPSDEVLVELGLKTEEQVRAEEEAREAEWEARRRAEAQARRDAQHAAYLKLKEMFEPPA